MSFHIAIIQDDKNGYNGGYLSPADATEKLLIEKGGVTITLSGEELAHLYNIIRPHGTAPKMERTL